MRRILRMVLGGLLVVTLAACSQDGDGDDDGDNGGDDGSATAIVRVV